MISELCILKHGVLVSLKERFVVDLDHLTLCRPAGLVNCLSTVWSKGRWLNPHISPLEWCVHQPRAGLVNES